MSGWKRQLPGSYLSVLSAQYRVSDLELSFRLLKVEKRLGQRTAMVHAALAIARPEFGSFSVEENQYRVNLWNSGSETLNPERN